jgi:hypothetical protein
VSGSSATSMTGMKQPWLRTGNALFNIGPDARLDQPEFLLPLNQGKDVP